MTGSGERLKRWWPWLLVGAITAIGLGLRIHQYGQSLFGDELSTLWIVSNNGLADTVRVVSSSAEITPPLYFVLAWFSTKLGSSPELVRLPALLVGTVLIPLTYLLGLRTVGRGAALAGASLMALSPFMIYFSANGRAYSTMILALVMAALAMLEAVRNGRKVWWFVYGASVCVAMYSHYIAVFVLVAELAWLLWAFPAARKPALLANAVAAIAYIPWIPSMIDDIDSPTTAILEAIQGTGFEVKKVAVEQVSFGHPLIAPDQMPANVARFAIVAGIALATLGALLKYFRTVRPAGATGQAEASSRVGLKKGLILVLAMAAATPVAEALLNLAGTDLFGSRNLAALWAGWPLLLGALLLYQYRLMRIACLVLVLSGFSIGAYRMTQSTGAISDPATAARYINDEAEPGDVVIDAYSALLTPVPLTSIDLYLSPDIEQFRLGLPVSEPPYLPSTVQTPDPETLISEAYKAARPGNRIFVVGSGKEDGVLAEAELLDEGQIESTKQFSVPPRVTVLSVPGKN